MKQKITFLYECEYRDVPTLGRQDTPRKLTVEIPGVITLTELIEQFEYFVKGIGFHPPENARLDYVDNNTDEPKSIP